MFNTALRWRKHSYIYSSVWSCQRETLGISNYEFSVSWDKGAKEFYSISYMVSINIWREMLLPEPLLIF